MIRANIIEAVKVKMEELTPFSQGLVVLSNLGVNPVTSYIQSTLDEATEAVLMILPLHLLIPKSLRSNGSNLSVINGLGKMDLPDDFLRIYAIKLNSWEREVNKAILTTDPEYKLQSNPYTRGKSTKPVVALNNTNILKYIELYSPNVVSDGVDKDFYIAKELPENLPNSLVKYIVLMTAIKVYDIIERADMAKILTEELNQLILSSK